MKKIEKTISRDLPLINIYAWHRGYTLGMKDWLDWSYSDSLFYVHDGFADIMRPPVEHLEEFKSVVLNKIESEPEWFNEENDKFHNLVNSFYEFNDEHINNIDDYNKQRVREIYDQYVDYVEKVVGPFILMIWFPIWFENDEHIKNKYSSEIEKMVESRIMSEQVFPRGDILINNILKKYQKELDLDDLGVRMVSRDEFIDFLENGNKPNKDTIELRKNGFLYSHKGVIITGDKKEDIEKTFSNIGYQYEIEDYSDVSEVKGSPACKGVVRGKIAVVMSKNKISEVVEGSVLVASMTTPEYLPAMKKAVAFVTDEGGITCHAAIVAREMSKPCIIGTKIATKVFKDGDMVEVDADNGVIKIIK